MGDVNMDEWQRIENEKIALMGTVEDSVSSLIREKNALLLALIQIAAYDDYMGSEHLAKAGSYSRFDEPGSVKIAREAIRACRIPVSGTGGRGNG